MITVDTILTQDGHPWNVALQKCPNGVPAEIASLSDIATEAKEKQAGVLKIDLTKCANIDSRGLQFLIDVHRQFTPIGISVVLQHPTPHLNHLFRIMNFDRLFKIEQ